MIYQKPRNLKYTDLCIYIDTHIYNGDYDEQKVFEYLYELFYVLALKKKFFTKSSDYDDYSLAAAGKLFLRLIDKRQFLPEGDPAKLPRIKSVLNYIKKVLYPLRVNYQKSTFAQMFVAGQVNNNETDLIESRMKAKALTQNQDLMRVEFRYYLTKISSTIKHFLKSSPYSNNSAWLESLHISCLLSLIKEITPSRRNAARLKKREGRNTVDDDLLREIYKAEEENSTTLFNLPESMYNYVDTVVKKLKAEIAKDLRTLLGSYEPPDQIIKGILSSPLEEYVEEHE